MIDASRKTTYVDLQYPHLFPTLPPYMEFIARRRNNKCHISQGFNSPCDPSSINQLMPTYSSSHMVFLQSKLSLGSVFLPCYLHQFACCIVSITSSYTKSIMLKLSLGRGKPIYRFTLLNLLFLAVSNWHEVRKRDSIICSYIKSKHCEVAKSNPFIIDCLLTKFTK